MRPRGLEWISVVLYVVAFAFWMAGFAFAPPWAFQAGWAAMLSGLAIFAAVGGADPERR